MERPLVAIIGDASKITQPDLAKKVGRELGAALAKRNCRILVFSSSQDFIDRGAVQGYLGVAKKLPGSLEVRYPTNLHALFPNEQPGDPVLFADSRAATGRLRLIPLSHPR